MTLWSEFLMNNFIEIEIEIEFFLFVCSSILLLIDVGLRNDILIEIRLKIAHVQTKNTGFV